MGVEQRTLISPRTGSACQAPYAEHADPSMEKGFCMKAPRLNLKVKTLLVLLVGQLGWQISASMAEESSSRPTKAVVETSPELGFKLSPMATQSIGVVTKAAEVAAGSLALPKNALVHSLDQLAIYRLRDGWFKLIAVTLASEKGDLVTVRSSEIKASDQIAIQGVALLRVADMEAFGGGE